MNNLATKKKEELLGDALSQLEAAAAPEYKENKKYASLSEELLESVLNSEDFSYDMNADALYNQYKDMYSEQGKQAAEHIYGLNSALTGGYGNSYASSAASAAYSEYMSALSEKAAELESNAYERYKDKNAALRENLETVNSLLENDYEKYRDSVSDYYKNEDLAVSKENQALKKEQLAAELKNDEISLAFKAADMGDYSLLSKLGIDTSSTQSERDFEAALKKAELGDYSELQKLGINTDYIEYSNTVKIAEELAKYGDYSGLAALGVDITDLQDKDNLAAALQKAQLGDYSALKILGFNTDALEYENALGIAKILAEYGDYSALEKLGVDISALTYAQMLEIAKILAEYGDYSALEELGINISDKKQ